MHAPVGSTFLSLLETATFALSPGSRAIERISTVPSYISEISFSNNLFKKLGSVLETIT
ncbi:hypothetical protein SDC9_160108 [bioreactor metagenome]|uniref:Uncharacterized protein n=1 Tax=bioreactor metagenome TaxID=1076179 RepID=A0A645FEG5_9ZZZZ